MRIEFFTVYLIILLEFFILYFLLWHEFFIIYFCQLGLNPSNQVCTHYKALAVKSSFNSYPNPLFFPASHMPSASLFSSLRQSWLRRNTFFLATVFGTALVTEIAVDGGVERFWEWKNRGKLWKDVAEKLSTEQREEEE